MDEIGRGTSTYDGLALAWACADHLAQKVRAFTLFATHYFEITQLASDREAVFNVHLKAVEHGDSIVFLHAVEEGPASQSYGLQVAALAGIPAAVLNAARRQLARLEARPADGPQLSLFAPVDAVAESTETEPRPDRLRQRLAEIEPDEITPRQALELLFELKKTD